MQSAQTPGRYNLFGHEGVKMSSDLDRITLTCQEMTVGIASPTKWRTWRSILNGAFGVD